MNILIVSQYYYPEQFQINEIAPALVKRGHNVTLLTGLPNYPNGVIPQEYKHRQRRLEVIDGVNVIRVYEHPRKKGALHLFANYLSFAISASLKISKLPKYDVVFVYQLSPITLALPAIGYKNKNEVPMFLYCLDLWPESALGHVKDKSGFLYKKIEQLSRYIYSQSDAIGVTTQLFEPYLRQLTNNDELSIKYIPQHASEEYLHKDMSSDEHNQIIFMYAGNLGAGQNLETLIKAISLIDTNKPFKLQIVGNGSKKSNLEDLVKELNLSEHVEFCGQKTRSQMKEYYKQANALVLTLRGNNAVGLTLPGKLQMYMTVGKPIFAAADGATYQIINESRCGICVNAGDSISLAKAMTDYIENPENYDICGNNAKEYFKKNFTLDLYLDKLLNEMESLL